jgi:pyrrolidone-carboxylate peptidase
MHRVLARLSVVLLPMSFGACSGAGEADEPERSVSEPVTVDTRTLLARAQYDANVAFAHNYRSRCDLAAPGMRVLVTGYGRFQGNLDNATGRIVEALVGAPYPSTQAPAFGLVDPPAQQTSVRTKTVSRRGVGPVSICGMILPVYWDLAPILLAREIEAFRPDFVVMNGVATGRLHLPMRVELGSTNIATTDAPDGSGNLRAFDEGAKVETKVIPEGPKTIASLLAWERVRSALAAGVRKRAGLASNVTGVDFGGYPSSWLTYLCNNLIYVTNYLMDQPSLSVSLLHPAVKRSALDVGVSVSLSDDYRSTPRVFIHWPDLPRENHADAAFALLEGIDAQLVSLRLGETPTRGDHVTPDQPPDHP